MLCTPPPPPASGMDPRNQPQFMVCHSNQRELERFLSLRCLTAVGHLFNLPAMEAQAEVSVGGGAKGHRKGQRIASRSGTFADERCSQAVLDFLSAADMRRIPGPTEGDTQNETSECELREREERERGGGWRPRRWELRLRNGCSPPRAILHGLGRRGVGSRGTFFLCPLFCLSSVIFLEHSPGTATTSRKDSGQETENCVHRHDPDRSHAINE